LAHFAARANHVRADIIKSKPHLGEGKLPFAEGKQGVQILAELGVLSDILAQPGANKYRRIRYQIAGALLRRPFTPGGHGSSFGIVIRHLASAGKCSHLGS
jgi:hypothetical protein